SSGDYSGSALGQIWLKNMGHLWMQYPSTFTLTAAGNIVADGPGDELRLDGLLHSPASLVLSSYTLSVSSFSAMPDMTYLDIGYGGVFNLGGTAQTPVVALSSVTIENNGSLTHWANGTTAACEGRKLNLTLTDL